MKRSGACTDAPAAPHPTLARFYRLLRDEQGLTETVVRTDYLFVNAEEVHRIARFFFGDGMGDTVRQRGGRIIPEWTGVRHRHGYASPKPYGNSGS